jgi:hypothetical protein
VAPIMKGRMGLGVRHRRLVEDLLKESNDPLTTSQIKDRLWEQWGRRQPTNRELGTFLYIHPSITKVAITKFGAEYLWVEPSLIV